MMRESELDVFCPRSFLVLSFGGDHQKQPQGFTEYAVQKPVLTHTPSSGHRARLQLQRVSWPRQEVRASHTHTRWGASPGLGGEPWVASCLLKLQPPLRIYQPRGKRL